MGNNGKGQFARQARGLQEHFRDGGDAGDSSIRVNGRTFTPGRDDRPRHDRPDGPSPFRIAMDAAREITSDPPAPEALSALQDALRHPDLDQFASTSIVRRLLGEYIERGEPETLHAANAAAHIGQCVHRVVIGKGIRQMLESREIDEDQLLASGLAVVKFQPSTHVEYDTGAAAAQRAIASLREKGHKVPADKLEALVQRQQQDAAPNILRARIKLPSLPAAQPAPQSGVTEAELEAAPPADERDADPEAEERKRTEARQDADIAATQA